MNRVFHGIVAAFCVGALVACGEQPARPNLGRLYRVGAGNVDSTPVILIPGAFGSRLRDRTTGVEAWPGTSNEILFGEYRDLALDFDPATLQVRRDNLEAYGITEAALGRDFYGQIIDTLRRFGGYVPAAPGTPAPRGERRYYPSRFTGRRACASSSCSVPPTWARRRRCTLS